MVDYLQQIKELEEELSKTPYNKRTQHHIGLVKAKIAKLRQKEMARGGGGGKKEGYAVRKSGDATVILIGYPSVGKSTLLNALTDANSEVGSYDFTTLSVIPGLLEYEYAKIQVLDVPGIVKGASYGKGRGKEVLSVMRNADLVLILVDVNHPEHYSILKKEIYNTGLRLNQAKPDVNITKKARGGISIGSTVKLTKIDFKTIADILREFKISNADVVVRTDITADQLIDVIEGNKKYVKALTVLAKIDSVDKETLAKVKQKVKPDIMISAKENINIERLKKMIFKSLNLIRIYCKEVGKPADLEVPLIIKQPCIVEDVCNKLHKDFVKNFRFCRVWGKSSRFPGQRLGIRHKLIDGDIVELHIK